MPEVVYARATCGIATKEGLPVHLTEGDVWAADDPIVRERPDFFSSEPVAIRRTTPPTMAELGIEQATSNPGQRRNR